MPKSIKFKEPNTTSNPLKRRRKTPVETRHTEEEWEEQKELILELWKTNGLKEVVDILANNVNKPSFVVTEPQLKNRLKAWGATNRYFKHSLTENQLRHIIEMVMERLSRGKKTAVRVQGVKIPSRKVNIILRDNYDIVQQYANVRELEVGDELRYTAPSGVGDELGTDSILGVAINTAPTIIESLRISVYTSSTLKGVRKPFLKFLKDDKSSVFDTILESSTPERPELTAEGVDEATISGPQQTMWDSISENIFKFGLITQKPRILDFEPKTRYSPSLNRLVLDLERQHVRQLYRSTNGSFDTEKYMSHAREKFIAFLNSRGGGNLQLYRRAINVNDPPADIWAVDVSFWYYGQASAQQNVSHHDGYHHVRADRSVVEKFCVAWCTRDADHWNRCLEEIGASFELGDAGDKCYDCGHSLNRLKADGPVIFTCTLNMRCWGSTGCQGRRIIRTLESRVTRTEPIYLPWGQATMYRTDNNYSTWSSED